VSRVVVVTGASAGVGRATVREMARRGWDVGLIARGIDGLEAAAHEVRALGRRAVAVPADVSDPAAVEAAADRIEAELGPIEVWINNAMVSVFSPISQMTAEEYRRVTEVTYLGYVYGTLAALRRMGARDRGVIVQVGSALAYRAIPLQSAYCAAKHAIEGFTESLRTELIHDGSGIRVTNVHLPAVNTPQFDWVKSRLSGRAQPVPPIFEPEVAARAIAHAAQHPRRELLVGRSTMAAVWANRIVPGVLDHYLGRAGYRSQQTDEPEDPDRAHNLWRPVPGDQGAHGRFSSRSETWSLLLWATTHRAVLGVALLALIGLFVRAADHRSNRS
jgi:NAD(P)-dependent dehydrogenase (short-subunit alcohol dehydrogenase family)